MIPKGNYKKKAKLRTAYYFKRLGEKMDEQSLFTMTSAVSFDLILSTIPFFLILLTVLGMYLNSDIVTGRITTALDTYLPVSGDLKEKFIIKAFGVINELRNNTLISGLIGIGGFLWTSSGMFATMRDVLNRLFGYHENRSFIHDKLKDFFLVLIIVVFFILTLAVSSISRIINFYNPEFLGIRLDLTFMQNIVSYLVGWAISFWMFFMIYKYVPNFRMPVKAAYFTAFIASFVYEIFKLAFTYYIFNYSNYNKVYGTFAALVITLLWIYFSCMIFVFGGAIGGIYFHQRHYKLISKRKKKNGTKKTI
jgi:membrane protein